MCSLDQRADEIPKIVIVFFNKHHGYQAIILVESIQKIYAFQSFKCNLKSIFYKKLFFQYDLSIKPKYS